MNQAAEKNIPLKAHAHKMPWQKDQSLVPASKVRPYPIVAVHGHKEVLVPGTTIAAFTKWSSLI